MDTRGDIELIYRKKLLLLAVAATLAIFIVACGGGDDDSSTGSTAPDSASGAGGSAGSGGDVAAGEVVFTANRCDTCHSTGSNVIIGPGLGGISARETDAYIKESITNPSAVNVEGYTPGTMPAEFGITILGDDLTNLIAYIKSLN
jgi:mono/diheme cytochrome c family protein